MCAWNLLSNTKEYVYSALQFKSEAGILLFLNVSLSEYYASTLSLSHIVISQWGSVAGQPLTDGQEAWS